MVSTPKKPVIAALDFADKQDALAFVDKVDPRQCRLKVGLQMYTKYGASFVELLQAKGFDVFLDLKFHDIPATVFGACQQVAKLGVWMTNVHALGGQKMLEQAANAVANSTHKPKLIGVTVLTSMAQQDLELIGLSNQLEDQVIRLSGLCKQAGLDGVVCSPREAQLIKQEFGQDFITVTPGIRIAGGEHHDQVRVMTPQQALDNGADYLVMGRSLVNDDHPNEMLRQIA